MTWAVSDGFKRDLKKGKHTFIIHLSTALDNTSLAVASRRSCLGLLVVGHRTVSAKRLVGIHAVHPVHTHVIHRVHVIVHGSHVS